VCKGAQFASGSYPLCAPAPSSKLSVEGRGGEGEGSPEGRPLGCKPEIKMRTDSDQRVGERES
jgi:hypothetical protein